MNNTLIFEGIYVDPSIKAIIPVDNLVVAATIQRHPKRVILSRDLMPANVLFHNIRLTVAPNQGAHGNITYQGNLYGKPKFHIALNEYGYWKWTSLDSAIPYEMLLVGSNETSDLYGFYPKITAVLLDEDRIALSGSSSQLSGMPIYNVPENINKIPFIRQDWFLSNVDDLHTKNGGYLASTGYNQSGSSLITVLIGIQTENNIEDLELKKSKGDIHYIYRIKDQLDPDKERITLLFYYGVKQTLSPMFVNMSNIIKLIP